MSKQKATTVLKAAKLADDFFLACSMTGVQNHVVADLPSPVRMSESVVSIPDLPPSVSRDEWVKGQQTDPSLSCLFDGVIAESGLKMLLMDILYRMSCL